MSDTIRPTEQEMRDATVPTFKTIDELPDFIRDREDRMSDEQLAAQMRWFIDEAHNRLRQERDFASADAEKFRHERDDALDRIDCLKEYAGDPCAESLCANPVEHIDSDDGDRKYCHAHWLDVCAKARKAETRNG